MQVDHSKERVLLRRAEHYTGTPIRRRGRNSMGFSDAVQWWDEWQLRILVLGSLFIQCFLFFSSMVRRFALPSWLRLFMWLAYLGGDALAIYALATLFNRHKQLPPDGSGLEVLWTPVLLIHLGGQHPMTAYSIEDNELWARHAITVVSQVTVALYVFCKSWSGEKRLLQSAILLFVVGIVRSVQKPWALKNGSITGMVASSSPYTRREQGSFACIWEGCISIVGSELSESGRQEEAAEEKDNSLEEFVQEARTCVLLSKRASDQENAKELASDSAEMYAYRLLVDISTPYSSRIKILKLLLALDCPHAHSISESRLRWLFAVLYTNWNMIFSGLGLCLHLLLPFVTLASVILFSTSHTHTYQDYNTADVKLTYILLCCTLPLDFLFLLLGPFSGGLGFIKVSQYSLLSFYARKNGPTTLMKLSTVVCCKDYVNMHCYIEHEPSDSSDIITELVLGYVKDGWKGYIHDAASYKRFNSHRGEWTLNKHRLGHTKRLGWSLKMAFDRSILLWHITTELCFHHQSTTPCGQERATPSRVISNYMAYLLSIRPEMLLLGSRNGIFSIACDDIELMMGGELEPDVRGLAQGILHRSQQAPSSHASNIGALVPNACRLAEALMELQDEQVRWEVIQGVWVEMLCYSASRCRGYLHAKNMNEGPELLSHVWILLAFMGMETSADRYQKSEPPETNEEEVEGGDVGGEGRSIQNEINISV
ncbi:hypothetical protein CFC21_086008 [Triticum aestivum]|uniref:DUF4220 domain-containing protein n=2 Tax=Triticum aestivum TaxID=4565 RepID=A0A3B6PET8_WHEAT|nr:hypothetical protein CFC21_086008 [Triticum aestivum]